MLVLYIQVPGKMFSYMLRLSYTSSERNNNTCDTSHFEFWPIASLEFISR